MGTRTAWVVLSGVLAASVAGLWIVTHSGATPDLLTADERSWVREHGVIRLAADPAFAPIESFDEQGRYVGIAADLYRLVEKRLGVDVEVVQLPTWSDVLDAARERRVDGITAAQMTQERSEYLVFSRPILDIPNVIVARRGAQDGLTFESMAGMEVAVTRGYANTERLLTKYPLIKVVEVKDDLTALKRVSFGEADTAVVNLAIASHLIEQEGFTNLKVAGDSGQANELMVATRSDQPILNRILDKGMASIDEGEKRAVFRRWVHLEAGPADLRTLGITLIVVVAAATVAVGLVLAWNQALRHQVQIRTELIRSQNEQLQQQNRELEEKGAQVQEAQERLSLLNADLEQRVQARTLELEDTNQELEAFAYSVSHDLRGPLRAVDGFSYALLEDYGEALDGEAKEFISRIRLGAAKMGQLIDDLLSLSRIGRAKIHFEETDLSELVRGIVDDVGKSHPGQSVDAVVRETPPVKADEALLRIVLQNLIDNAWKFTSKVDGATVEFGFSGEESAFYVRDNGAGFDQKDASKLFAPFQRLHTEAEFAGTGIGLAIVQRVIRRHGGRVWARGEVNRGATVFFTIEEVPQGEPVTAL